LEIDKTEDLAVVEHAGKAVRIIRVTTVGRHLAEQDSLPEYSRQQRKCDSKTLLAAAAGSADL